MSHPIPRGGGAMRSRFACALAVTIAVVIGVVAPGGAVDEKGQVTEFSVGLTPDGSLEGITAGPDGNLWFTELDGRVGRITPDGSITEFTAGITRGSQDTQLSGITAGPDGNVWYTSKVNNGEGDERGRIGRVTPDGAIVEFSAGITGKPDHITAGADGNLWFVKVGQSFVGRITPEGVVTEFAIDNSKFYALTITTGPDGRLWFKGDGSRDIGRITPEGKITMLSGGPGADNLTTGCDGNLWFGVGGAGVWRMTPKGKITKIRAGFTGYPDASTAGPDGNIWVTEGSTGAGARIARIETPVAKSRGKNAPTLPDACPRSRR